jgi:hypothetical protein
MSVVVALTLPVVALMVNAVEFLAGVVTRKRAKAYRTSVARPHNGTPFPHVQRQHMGATRIRVAASSVAALHH